MLVPKIIFLMLIAFFPACAFAANSCSVGEMVVIVNKSNPEENLSMTQIRKLLLAEVHTWPNHTPVTVVRRESGSASFECVLSNILHMSEADYKRYVLAGAYRGEESVSIRIVNSKANAVRAVLENSGAIAVVEGEALAGLATLVKIVKVDGKLPGELKYPF